jgi:hypothetical protein
LLGFQACFAEWAQVQKGRGAEKRLQKLVLHGINLEEDVNSSLFVATIEVNLGHLGELP